MSITHHLTDETLSEYSAGNLNEALEVVVACHLTLCPQCRQRSSYADVVGGHFLDTAEPVDPTLGAQALLRKSRDAAIGALVQTKARPPQESSSREMNTSVRNSARNSEMNSGMCKSEVSAAHDVPMPLARKLPAKLDSLNWRGMAPGIKQFNLQNTPLRDGAFKLLKLEPGVELVEHSHGGHELTLVLRGSYSDSMGRFGLGDVADLGDDVTHRPVVDSEEPCIALIATTSPAKYTSLVGKILQPFVGI